MSLQQRTEPSGRQSRRRLAGTGSPDGRQLWAGPPELFGALECRCVEKIMATHQASHFQLSRCAGFHDAEDGVDAVVIVVGGFDLEGVASLSNVEQGNSK